MAHVVVSREDYFDAAMRILATEGAGKLKIAHLCRSLHVTTGSFYGYFGNLDGFVREFLAHWEYTSTLRVGSIVAVEPDPVLRVRALKKFAAEIPHDAEAAIRGWAHSNDTVQEFVDRVDQERQQMIVDSLSPVTGKERAEQLAIVGMTLLVGLQQWRRPVTTADYELVFSEFENLVLSDLPVSAPQA
ncbi:TetR/AcrR family transcriptional regulator [Gordonia sinesedis]